MIELSFAREHVEVKYSKRFAAGRIGDEKELQIVDPFVGRGDFFKLQAENALINIEHSLERFLKREVNTERFLIDGVLLFVELIGVVTPVPDADPGVGIVRVRGFHFLKRGNFRVELRLNAGDEIVDVRLRARGGLGQARFGLVVVPRFVAES